MTRRHPPLSDALTLHRAYFDGSTSGIFVYSEDGRLLDLNAAACRMHGRTREEMLSLDPREFIAPSSHHIFEAFRAAVAQGKTFRAEAQGLHSSGSTFDVEVSGELIEVAGKRYLFSSLLDITERKALATQLQHSQRLDAIGQLAGGVVHDFNNLLSVILGYAELLGGGLTDEGQRKDVRAIVEAGHRARELVGRLLAFSRRQRLSVALTDINAFILEQVDTLRRVLPETIEVSFRPAPHEVQVPLDRAQLEQVLLNLAVNAQDAMPDGGRLTLELFELDVDEAYAARCPDLQPGRHVLLSVSDTGVGMDPETCSRIFEPFFTTKPTGKGTGLGLSLVHGSVKQHGGQVVVRSEVGRGTCLQLYLPLGAAVEAHVQERTAADARGGDEHVLVVEDSPPVRDLASRALEGLGYRVSVAGGVEAARMVGGRLEHLDLVLTDVVLPTGNGRQVYEQLRRAFPRLRVVYMSGYTESVISEHGIFNGENRFVSKPFGVNDLAAAVRDTLDSPLDKDCA